MKNSTVIGILTGTGVVAGTVVGICCNKIYTLTKLEKTYNKALKEEKEALKYDRNNPEDVEKVKAMSTKEFLDWQTNFNEAHGRCSMVEDLIDIFTK